MKGVNIAQGPAKTKKEEEEDKESEEEEKNAVVNEIKDKIAKEEAEKKR